MNNDTTYADYEGEWEALTEEEQQQMLEDTKAEIDQANEEAALYWAAGGAA